MQKYLVGRWSREQEQRSSGDCREDKQSTRNGLWIKAQLYDAVPQMRRSAMAGNNVNPFLIINCDDGECAAALQDLILLYRGHTHHQESFV